MKDDRKHAPGGIVPGSPPDEAGSTALRRIPLTLTVRKEYEFLSEFLAEFGEHIYPEGMFIPTPRPKPKGALVKVDFSTHDGFQILRATCEVVRADEALPGTLSGMWVTFRVMDDSCRALVTKIWQDRESSAPRQKPPGIGEDEK